MSIPTLASFKTARKAFGSISAVLWMLGAAGVSEEAAEHSIDGLAADIGVRNIEKAKTKDLYDFCDGVILYWQEHHVPNYTT